METFTKSIRGASLHGSLLAFSGIHGIACFRAYARPNEICSIPHVVRLPAKHVMHTLSRTTVSTTKSRQNHKPAPVLLEHPNTIIVRNSPPPLSSTKRKPTPTLPTTHRRASYSPSNTASPTPVKQNGANQTRPNPTRYRVSANRRKPKRILERNVDRRMWM